MSRRDDSRCQTKVRRNVTTDREPARRLDFGRRGRRLARTPFVVRPRPDPCGPRLTLRTCRDETTPVVRPKCAELLRPIHNPHAASTSAEGADVWCGHLSWPTTYGPVRATAA